MAIIKSGETPFQAYARLISVLGDQLISDKWVGVIELVKNSYDADAEKVIVRFLNFDNPSASAKPTIEIEDDGHGMNIDTILDVWMKPATPNKLNKKKAGDKRFTEKGRVMQGDKGVGRFAIYKLGDYVEVYSKTKSTGEVKLTLDFHDYADDEFKESEHQDKYLHEILNKWEVNDKPEKIINAKEQGTLIRISDIRSDWKFEDLIKLDKAFFRMKPPKLPGLSIPEDFQYEVIWDHRKPPKTYKRFDEISDLAPYYFEGMLDSHGNLDAIYTHNKSTVNIQFNLFEDELDIISSGIRSLKAYRDQFLKYDKKEIVEIRKPEIGGFMFFFYAYDLRDPALTKDEIEFLKETSVYLYRDNIRVYPYGEIGDDWLKLSKSRGELKAGDYFTYNDLLGFVFITQDENPKLRDAADREGLMNINGAKDDFIALVQTVLKVMKTKVDIDRKKEELKNQKAIKSLSKSYEESYNTLQKKLLEYDDAELIDRSKKFFNATNNLIQKVREDLKITQELAGTGMAVEKATHDTMSLLKRLKVNTEDFVNRFDKGKIQSKELRDFLVELQENLEFLYQELQVLQPLFRVARKVTKDVSVRNVTERVIKYFRKELEGKIKVNLDSNKDIVVKTNTGLILQVILNLMDNSIYWLEQLSDKDKQISIVFNEDDNTVIFADTGPGIPEDIEDLIFTEFYTKKSEGRGLGLYIVKELLDRIDAEISLITNPNLRILKGANFIIKFKKEEK
ncbi:Signal transduction histidine kinase [Cyclobacterium lianum]|uniref:histidine kinase n=1 Tax=Cyclobacterium lianum TaxID=388280 RepID=A0A1M7P552_9BACT|nr:ATP-binding protein [Cyclobacterium lianum]SHN11734.1 Signal transduction histidine kinase [Cyclobacterium lianum]